MHIPCIRQLSVQDDGMTDYLHGIHELINKTIIDNNAWYKTLANTHHKIIVFDVGDQVWAILTRDRFPVGGYNKFKERKIRSYKVLQKINDNVYRLRLPIHLKTFDVFNVKHLTPYLKEE
jgi:hypothetical protein